MTNRTLIISAFFVAFMASMTSCFGGTFNVIVTGVIITLFIVQCYLRYKEEKRRKRELKIYRVSCRACDEMFSGLSLEEAIKRHQKHIKTCPALSVLEKVEKFRKESERILGRKMSFKEALKIVVENN